MSEDGAAENDQAAAERLISLAEAAERCGLSHDHLRNLVRTGKIWGTKIGRNWVTSEAAVRTYLATDRRPGPKPKSPPPDNN
jgi:excisionase family DNA binding protein